MAPDEARAGTTQYAEVSIINSADSVTPSLVWDFLRSGLIAAFTYSGRTDSLETSRLACTYAILNTILCVQATPKDRLWVFDSGSSGGSDQCQMTTHERRSERTVTVSGAPPKKFEAHGGIALVVSLLNLTSKVTKSQNFVPNCAWGNCSFACPWYV
jgi:hypothetical protein